MWKIILLIAFIGKGLCIAKAKDDTVTVDASDNTLAVEKPRQYPINNYGGYEGGYNGLGGFNGFAGGYPPMGGGGGGGVGGFGPSGVGGIGQPGIGMNGCPLCDSSVYSYCDYKVLHDSCCCNYPGHLKPPQCTYSDCNLLYAKTCYEHTLIQNCCCNSPY